MPNGDTLVICGNVASGPPPEKRITLASLVAPRLVSRFCTAKQCRINSLDFQDFAKTLCFSLKSNTVYFPACAAGPAGRQHQRRGVRVAGPRVPAQKDGRTGAMQCASLLLAPPSPTCASMCRMHCIFLIVSGPHPHRCLCLQQCTFKVDYTLPTAPGMEFGSVFIGEKGENVAAAVVAAGWARVRRIMSNRWRLFLPAFTHNSLNARQRALHCKQQRWQRGDALSTSEPRVLHEAEECRVRHNFTAFLRCRCALAAASRARTMTSLQRLRKQRRRRSWACGPRYDIPWFAVVCFSLCG